MFKLVHIVHTAVFTVLLKKRCANRLLFGHILFAKFEVEMFAKLFFYIKKIHNSQCVYLLLYTQTHTQLFGKPVAFLHEDLLE
jgi:hypothetical protein